MKNLYFSELLYKLHYYELNTPFHNYMRKNKFKQTLTLEE